MASITFPDIDFNDLKIKVSDGRFTSKTISTFAEKRIGELLKEHEAIKRLVQEGNEECKKLALKGIEVISKKCSEGYPDSFKVRQLDELKALLVPIEQKYCALRDLLTEEERTLEEAEKLFLSDCGAKKSQLLRNEQEEYEKSPLFQAFLEKIEQKTDESPRETIYFAYAWPTDSRYERESWIQPFLKNLQAHLKKSGFPTVQLDIVSNRYGTNIYEFMEEAQTSGYVLLFGTESLLDKFSKGISTVCTELMHILRKKEEDGKDHVHRVFPILLSGEHRSAFPPEYERFSTTRDWRDHSYLHNFQQLFLELLGLSPEIYQSKLEKYWKDLLPLETPSISNWYQQQREMVDTCRRNNDREGLHAIEVSRNLPLAADEASPQPTFVERLKEHYTTRSTITILTFREKGKWELTLPVESLYTKLAMITEEERDERRDPSTFVDDGRLPTHETIFKAKKEVPPEEIFKLAKGKRAVIYGSAGIGKTTFTKMLLYKWAKEELFTEFQVVLCIRLKNLTKNFYPKGPVYHADDILNREYESLGLDRIDCDPNFALLILDGWDELPPETREGGHLAGAFQELQEHYPNLLITSRPGTIDVDATEFEILGFSDAQIGIYTDRFFHTIDSKAAGIKRFIRQNPLARSLAHIPINLTILCALYDEDDTLFNSETLLTNSALYDRIINQFYKIFLLRRGASQNEVRFSSFLSMHPKIWSLVSCLEEIAYNAALKEEIYTNEREIVQIVYRKELEIEDMRKLGLFRIENQEGSFIHLTFQEYFAALHISRFYKSSEARPQALEIVRRIKFNRKFVRILSMVAGVLSISERQEALQSYFDDLHSEPRDKAEIYELTLLARCFEECDCPTSLSQYADFIDRAKQLVKSFPLKYLITTVFRGNQKLLFHPDIVILFNELLSHKHSRKNLLSILYELTSYSAMLPPEIFQKLKECLYERVSQKNIIYILKNIVGEEAINTLISLVKDPMVDQDVRQLAANALGKIASAGERIGEKGVEALISFVTDPEVNQLVRRSEAETLGAIAKIREEVGEKVVEALISFVTDPEVNQLVRRSAVEALGAIAKVRAGVGEKVVETLISLVANPKVNQNMRRSAVEALGAIAKVREGIGEKDVEAFISLVANPKVNQNVRRLAVEALGAIAKVREGVGEKVVETLISLVANPKVNQNVRKSAVEALGAIAKVREGVGEKVVETLISLVANPKVNQNVRRSAVEALGAIAKVREGVGEKVVETLISLVANPKANQNVRRSAVEALGAIAKAGERIGEKGVEALISLVANPKANQNVRRSAVEALGAIAKVREGVGEKVVETLISLVANPKVNQNVRRSAVEALGAIASVGKRIGEKGVDALISLVADQEVHQDVHKSAKSALEKIASGKEEVKAIISLVANLKVNQDVRKSAESALGKIASEGEGVGEKGVEALISLIANLKVNQDTRESAALEIWKIALSEEGIKTLIHLVADPEVDQFRRNLAAYALGVIGSGEGGIGERDIGVLMSLLVDLKENQEMFFSVAKVLVKIASAGERIGEKGIETLISFVEDPEVDRYVRESAVEALGKIASARERIGEKGIEVLISLVADTKGNDYLCESALETLGKIASAGERIGEKGIEVLISLVANLDVSHNVHRLAAEAIGAIAKVGEGVEEKDIEVLISLAKDPEIEKYGLAVEALGEIAKAGGELGEKVIETLISLVADSKVDQDQDMHRLLVAYILGKIALAGENIGEKGVEALTSLAKDPKVNQDTHWLAVEALEATAKAKEGIGKKVVEALISLAKDPEVDQDVHGLAANALGKIASAGEDIGEKGLEALISFVADSKVDQYVHGLAVKAHGIIAPGGEDIGEKGLEALISFVADSKVDQYVHGLAAIVLGKIASAEEGIGKKVDEDVRRSAAFAIEKIASAEEGIGEKVVEVFISLAANSEIRQYVRFSAAKALGKIAKAGGSIGENGINALCSLFADPKVDQNVRSISAFVFFSIAPHHIIDQYPENVVKLFCRATRRGLINKNEKWTITNQIM